MTDNFDELIDDDMLDGFDDFDSFDNPEDSTGSRDTISDVKAGALEALSDPENNASLVRKIAKTALPSGFGVAIDDLDDVTKDFSNVYSGVEKNLNRTIKDTKRLINDSIGSAAFIPEGIRDKILSATEAKDDDNDRLADVPSAVDTAVMSSDAAIFGKWAESLLESNREGMIVDAEAKGKSIEKASELLNEMRKITAYNSHVQSPFQRKSLELQFRQYYALKDLVEHGRASTADSVKFLEAITKNTSLPDIQKTKLSEEYNQAVTDRFSSSLGESVFDYTSGFREKIKSNATDKLNSVLEMVQGGVENVGMLAGTVADLDEESRNTLLAGEAVGGLAGWLSGVAGKRLNKLIGDNPSLLESSNNLLYWKENFPSLLSGWLESKKDDSWILEQINDIVPSFSGSDISISGDLATDALGATSFDNVSHNTVNTVIPGYLARILQQVTILNSGDNDTPLMTYGLKSRTFEDLETASSRVKAELAGNAGSNQYAFDNIFSTLDGKKTLSDEARKELAETLLNDSVDGNAFNLNRLNETKFDNEEISSLISEIVSRSALERSQIDLKLAREQSQLSSGITNADKVINRTANLGQRDVIEAMGLVDYSADGTGTFNNSLLRKDIISSLDLTKQYVGEDGQTISGSVALSEDAKRRQEELSVLAREKGKKGKPTPEEESELAKLKNLSNAIRDTATENVSGSSVSDILRSFNKSMRKALALGSITGLDDARQNAIERIKDLDLKPATFSRTLEKLDGLAALAKGRLTEGREGGLLASGKRSLDGLTEGLGPGLTKAKDFANGDFAESLKEAKDNALLRIKESGFNPLDFNRENDRLNDLVATAQQSIASGVEGLNAADFSVPAFVNKIKLGDAPTTDTDVFVEKSPAAQNESQEDILNYIRESTDTDSGMVMTPTMMEGFSEILRVFGKEQLQSFKLDFMQDSTDGIRALPVIMTGESTEVTSVHDLIEVNTRGFEALESGLGMVNESILASMVNSAAPEERSGVLGTISKFVKTTGQGLGSFSSAYFKGATGLTRALAGGAAGIAGGFGRGIGKGLGLMGSKGKDIYVNGAREPALLAKHIKTGEYTDVNTGKKITSVKDITGAVTDSLGNTVLTQEEFGQGLSVIDPSGGGSAFKMIMSPLNTLFNLPLNMVKASIAIPKAILGKINGLWRRPFDVYVAEESNPRLMANIFKNGGYRSRNTGKLITHPDKIDGEVEDLQGNILISNEDIMKGLYTRSGRKIGDSKLYSMVTSVLSTGLGIVKRSVGLGVKAVVGSVKLGTGIIKGTAGAALGAAGFLLGKGKGKTEGTGEFDPVNMEVILESIYSHMVKIWPETDFDSDYEVSMLEKQQEIIDAINSAGGSPVKQSGGSDIDGDGDRDGGWKDIFQRRKDLKTDAEEVKVEKVEKEKRTSVFDTILGMLGKFLPMIGTGLAGLASALVGSSFAKNLMGGGGPDVDLDLPDRDKGGKRSRKPRGKMGKLKQLAKNGLGKLNNPTLKKGAGIVAGQVGKRALVKGATAGAGALAAAAGATVGGVALAPVIAAAGIAYTAFEIGSYFYDRRDTEQLERLRFLQYGVDSDYGLISNIRELESELDEFVVLGDKPSLNIPVSVVVEEYADIFGVDTSDPAQVDAFTSWFTRRFTPVFLTHKSVLNNLDASADLDDIDDDMDEELIPQFVKRTVNSAKHLESSYSVTATPSPGDTILSNASQIKEFANILINQNGGKADSKAQPTVSPKVSQAVKASTDRKGVLPSPKQATKSLVNEASNTKEFRGEYRAIGTDDALHLKPADGEVIERDGYVEIGTEENAPIKASDDGSVIKMRYSRKIGKIITVKHSDNSTSEYSGLSKYEEGLKLGSKVKRGDVIGTSGWLDDREGVRWKLMKPGIDGYQTVSPLDYIDGGSRESIPVLTSVRGNSTTQPTNHTQGSATGIQSIPVSVPPAGTEASVASTALMRDNKIKQTESKELVKALSVPIAKQSETLRNDYQASMDGDAKEQRTVMIANQGSMVEALNGILNIMTSRSKSTTAKSSTPVRQVKSTTTPVTLNKKSQFV